MKNRRKSEDSCTNFNNIHGNLKKSYISPNQKRLESKNHEDPILSQTIPLVIQNIQLSLNLLQNYISQTQRRNSESNNQSQFSSTTYQSHQSKRDGAKKNQEEYYYAFQNPYQQTLKQHRTVSLDSTIENGGRMQPATSKQISTIKKNTTKNKVFQQPKDAHQPQEFYYHPLTQRDRCQTQTNDNIFEKVLKRNISKNENNRNRGKTKFEEIMEKLEQRLFKQKQEIRLQKENTIQKEKTKSLTPEQQNIITYHSDHNLQIANKTKKGKEENQIPLQQKQTEFQAEFNAPPSATTHLHDNKNLQDRVNFQISQSRYSSVQSYLNQKKHPNSEKPNVKIRMNNHPPPNTNNTKNDQVYQADFKTNNSNNRQFNVSESQIQIAKDQLNFNEWTNRNRLNHEELEQKNEEHALLRLKEDSEIQMKNKMQYVEEMKNQGKILQNQYQEQFRQLEDNSGDYNMRSDNEQEQKKITDSKKPMPESQQATMPNFSYQRRQLQKMPETQELIEHRDETAKQFANPVEIDKKQMDSYQKSMKQTFIQNIIQMKNNLNYHNQSDENAHLFTGHTDPLSHHDPLSHPAPATASSNTIQIQRLDREFQKSEQKEISQKFFSLKLSEIKKNQEDESFFKSDIQKEVGKDSYEDNENVQLNFSRGKSENLKKASTAFVLGGSENAAQQLLSPFNHMNNEGIKEPLEILINLINQEKSRVFQKRQNIPAGQVYNSK